MRTLWITRFRTEFTLSIQSNNFRKTAPRQDTTSSTFGKKQNRASSGWWIFWDSSVARRMDVSLRAGSRRDWPRNVTNLTFLSTHKTRYECVIPLLGPHSLSNDCGGQQMIWWRWSMMIFSVNLSLPLEARKSKSKPLANDNDGGVRLGWIKINSTAAAAGQIDTEWMDRHTTRWVRENRGLLGEAPERHQLNVFN